MDAAVTGVAMAALVADGILAGLSLDKVIGQLPARRRIGITGYAPYARTADLGNDIARYGAAGVGGAALTVAAFAVAAALGAPGALTGLLAAGAALSLAHSAMTGRAAPAMLRIGRAGDGQAALAPLLARFAAWSAARAAAQGRRSSSWRSPWPSEPDRPAGKDTAMQPASDPPPAALDRAAIIAEMDQARLDFRRLAAAATAADLRRRSDGTKWTNQELLFHMLLGYLVVRALLVLVRVFGLLPDPASKAYARLLDAARGPFDQINYLGSRAGARILPPRRMSRMAGRVIAALQHRLRRETQTALRAGMHVPATWDPLFTSYMTLADVYRYPTRHFRFHQRQLTLSPPPGKAAT